MNEKIKPAVRFLLIFLAGYVGLSVAYGLWIESHGKRVDWLTKEVTREVTGLISYGNVNLVMMENKDAPTILIRKDDVTILEVFEGCNGVNVMIVFVSFVLAFGGTSKPRMSGFLFAGLVLIHLANLLRLLGLYGLVLVDKRLFYYYHKFIFTAILYVMVFGLWWLWISRWSGLKRS